MRLYRLHHTLIALLFIVGLSASAGGQGNEQIGKRTKNTSFAKVAIGETVPEIGKSAWVVFQDRSSHYWFGSDGNGVYRHDGKLTTRYSTKDGLCNDHIREIQQDKSGNIFFTTLDGISKFDGQTFTTLTVTESKAADKGWTLQADDLWFKGQPGKNGPYRFDGQLLYDLRFPKHYLENDFVGRYPNVTYSPYEVYAIYKDRSSSIWFGTSNFGICRYDGKTLSWMYEEHLTLIKSGGSFGIRSILEDSFGKFWICNTRYRYAVDPNDTCEKEKGLINYKRETGINSLKTPSGADHIYFQSIVEDYQRDLWMATYNLGVWRYDGKNVTRYPVNDGDKEVALISIYKDNFGHLWLGTQDAGPYKFNGKAFEKFHP